MGCEPVTDFRTALPRADFVTVHCPLQDDTRNLIGAPELALMKPSAYVINCARGGIVNEAALVDALNSRRIKGAALDVQVKEPPAPDDPLLTCGRHAGDHDALVCDSGAERARLLRRAAAGEPRGEPAGAEEVIGEWPMANGARRSS
jgi:lactate dehydrogenase-like 2-hydroxyacid dehydrogenase